MSETPARLTRQQIRETLQALDQHTVDSLQARLDGRPGPAADNLPPLARQAHEQARSGTNDDYSDLPEPVLQIFEDDKGNNQTETENNRDSTTHDINWYNTGAASKQDIEQQLKERDQRSLDYLKKLLDDSRGKLESELEGLDRQTQDHAHAGRAAENTHLDDHWSKIVTNVENWFDQTEDDIVTWFDGAITTVTTFFKNFFGF